ncbi:MAG: alpha/beta hydrolase [Solirubrobacteraceae bacterium]
MTLALEESGEGPAIVGLHGLTATRRYVLMGSRTLERAGRRVVLVDARGHGASTSGPFSYGELAADLLAVLDALGIERALIVGVSMGAQTAIAFALAHPDRVRGLALITPAFEPDRPPAGLARWDALAAGLRNNGVDGFVAAYDVGALPPAWREQTEKLLRQRMALHADLGAVADALQAIPRSRPFESFAQLADLSVPALVVGSRDEADPAHPLRVAHRYAESLPCAELRVEPQGASPLAWQGGRLSRAIAELDGV